VTGSFGASVSAGEKQPPPGRITPFDGCHPGSLFVRKPYASEMVIMDRMMARVISPSRDHE
jgi:hypothetical protein